VNSDVETGNVTGQEVHERNVDGDVLDLPSRRGCPGFSCGKKLYRGLLEADSSSTHSLGEERWSSHPKRLEGVAEDEEGR
jgi:hypothetical protein